MARKLTFGEWSRERKRQRHDQPMTVAQAREWFRLFGQRDDLLSETGRRAFRCLLRELDRLKAMEG